MQSKVVSDQEKIIKIHGANRKCWTFECNFCEKHFLQRKELSPLFCSLACRHKSSFTQVEKKCDHCGKNSYKTQTQIKNNKTGLYFCSNECQQNEQKIGGKLELDHYGNGKWTYRAAAFREYGKMCNSCGYNEYEEMLDVHHIDQNRDNNNPDNLEVLCVWCHMLKHRKVPNHKRL